VFQVQKALSLVYQSENGILEAIQKTAQEAAVTSTIASRRSKKLSWERMANRECIFNHK